MTNEDLERKAIEFVSEFFHEVINNRIDVGLDPLPPKFMGVFYMAGVKSYMAGYQAGTGEQNEKREERFTKLLDLF